MGYNRAKMCMKKVLFFMTMVSVVFTAYPQKKVVDIEGNAYNVTVIGTQTWMAENLCVTKYKDGTAIKNVTSHPEWANLTSGAYCWYNNDDKNKMAFGALYNWYAVETDKLCPNGWHVPSAEEWEILIKYLDAKKGSAVMLKNRTSWYDENGKENNIGTDDFGFSAVASGWRSNLGVFIHLFQDCYFWSSKQDSYYIRSGDIHVMRFYAEKAHGFCVRCIKNK